MCFHGSGPSAHGHRSSSFELRPSVFVFRTIAFSLEDWARDLSRASIVAASHPLALKGPRRTSLLIHRGITSTRRPSTRIGRRSRSDIGVTDSAPRAHCDQGTLKGGSREAQGRLKGGSIYSLHEGWSHRANRPIRISARRCRRAAQSPRCRGGRSPRPRAVWPPRAWPTDIARHRIRAQA